MLRLIIELAALISGGYYLWFKHRQRVRNWTPRDDPQKWTGHGIEVSEVRPGLERLHRACLVGRRAAQGTWFRRSLVELARHAVVQLGYFQNRTTDQEAHKYGP